MLNLVLLAVVQGVFRVAHRFDARCQTFHPERIKRILVVTTTAIGDTLLSTPAIRQIRRRWPQAHIAAMVSPAAEQVLRHNPHLDELIIHPGKVTVRYLWHLPGMLRRLRQQFDLAVILHANDPDIVPLMYSSGIPHRYGWAESKLAFLLTVPVPTRQAGLHGLTEKIRNLAALGITSDDEQMEMAITDEERSATRQFLAAAGVRGPYLCLHPFGSRRSRWWGTAAEWSVLARAVRERWGWPLILVGTAPEKLARVAADGGLISAVNRLRLRESAALLGGARAAITTDSGPLHLAQALAVPTLGLFGASLPEITGPRRNDALVLRGSVTCAPCSRNHCAEQECMRQLTPDKVLTALAALLQQTAAA